MSKRPDPYASEEDTRALLRKDTRTPAERKLDQMLEDRGASEQGAEPFLILRQIALEMLEEQPAPVQGWKLVPVDPTPEQIKEGNKVTWPLPCAQAYSTMLAAAPQPAQQEPWVGLTENELEDIWERHHTSLGGWDYGGDDVMYYRHFEPAVADIEAKLKEKNA